MKCKTTPAPSAASSQPTPVESPYSASTPSAPSTTATSGSPTHYSHLDPQAIEVIEAWGLGFHAGNAVKYIARYRQKGTPARDLRKAAWYLLRLADLVDGRAGKPAPQV